ncbi:MAG: protein kinase [Lachnospiraceae bacterium]|nr:protein kinase [Lachnospiraceae bacterium]
MEHCVSSNMSSGTKLKGRYIIRAVAGAGGFGIVYEAWDEMMKSKVAIKEYHAVQADAIQPEEYAYDIKCFLNEARIMAKFDMHPNVVHIFDYFEENGAGYIVMEFLEGSSLKQFLMNQHGLSDIDMMLGIAESMCDILGTIHKAGIIHRDLSPDNIFICSNGDVKLIDFGASRLMGNSSNSTRVVKSCYAPPEQYSDEKSQGPWTDVYALGAVMYRIITGQIPIESVRRKCDDGLLVPSELNPDIPEYLDNVIMKAMDTDPHMRYRNMDELRNALHNDEDDTAVQQKTEKKKTRKITGIICAAVIMAICLITAVLIYYRGYIMCGLPEAELELWIPSDDDAGIADKMEKVLEEFNNKYKDHVKIDVKEIPYSEYYDILSLLNGTKSMPVLFYTENKQNKYKEGLSDISGKIKGINAGKYLCAADIGKSISEEHMLPTGLNCFVVYVNNSLTKDATEVTIDKKLIRRVLERQLELGNMEYYQAFLRGEKHYYIGSTSKYHQIINSRDISSYIEIYDMSDICSYGYFTDYWCISSNAGRDEKICAEAVLSYMMQENCQRIFFTVDSTRISSSMPLNKEIFITNYYQNGVGDKMDFLKDNAGKMDMYEYTGDDEACNILLEKIAE